MRVTDTIKVTIVASVYENAEVKAATLKVVDLLDTDLENSGFMISDDVEEALDALDDLLEPEVEEEKVEKEVDEDEEDDEEDEAELVLDSEDDEEDDEEDK